jgi:uncharacterized protein DUF6928
VAVICVIIPAGDEESDGAVRADAAEVVALVREMHPGYEVTPIDDGVLGEDTYPPDDTNYATVLAGAELSAIAGSSTPPIAATRPSAMAHSKRSPALEHLVDVAS